MSECEKCGKILRDRYNLLRHQSRSRPCTDICSEIGDDTLEKNSPKQSKNSSKNNLNLTANSSDSLIKDNSKQLWGKSEWLQSVVVDVDQVNFDKYFGKIAEVEILKSRPSSLVGKILN